MSAKNLGMIHTVNTNFNILAGTSGKHVALDLSSELSSQLQRMVRQGNFFKLVGIDMAVAPNPTASSAAGRISGEIRYFVPTAGRCAAYREAFRSMAEQMNIAGIPMRGNPNYDFRAAMTDFNTPALENQATLDGTNGLALSNLTNPGASIFGVHNSTQLPVQTLAGADFSEGFDTLVNPAGAAKTDFVLNDGLLFSGNEHIASLQEEAIPFQVAYGGDDTTATFQFRPDPALYVAIMCGLFEISVDDVQLEPGTTSLEITTSFMVAGWKSIMGEPKKSR
jgi:hypothetical protein